MKPVVFPDVGYTPANLRLLLKRTHTTQQRAAALLGVHERTVNSWCSALDKPQHTDMPSKKWVELQNILNEGLKQEKISLILNSVQQ